MSKREIDPDRKIESVTRAARQLFVKNGFYSVSIPSIVEASGVSTGAIYNLFGNKENLARLIHEKTLADFQEMFLARVSARPNTSEKLRAFAELIFDLTETEPDMMEYMLFMKHAEFMSDCPPICFTEPFRLIQQIISEGIMRGEVRQGDFIVAGLSYTGVILRAAELRLLCVLQTPLHEISEDLIRNAWDGIKA